MNNFKSDAERMAAIEAEAIGKFWEVRFAVVPFQLSLLQKAHAEDSWRTRRALFKHCRQGEKVFREHVAQCKQCLPLFVEGARQINEFLTKKLAGGLDK